MTRYNLPESLKAGFTLIGGINNENAAILCEIINSAILGEQPADLANKGAGKIPYEKEDIKKIFETIYSIINFLNEIDKDDPDIINDIVESFGMDYGFENNTDKEILISNLKRVLTADGPILQTIKGYNLLSDADKVFMKSKIISDVRLVFDNDINKKTRGAVLIHQLKITFRENGDWKDIFVTLDSNDLNNLSESISRAVEKEKLIYNNIFTKDLSFIKPTKE